MSAGIPVTSAALGGLAVLAALLAAPVAAQSAPDERHLLRAGVGSAQGLSQPGQARETGPAAFVAAEVPVVGPLWLRTELGAAAQSLASRPGGPLSGDVQQVHLVAAARWTPIAARVAPYALAGGGVFWRSDRFSLNDTHEPVHGAVYRVTTSRHARGALLGAGVDAALPAVRLFLEARWTRVGSPDGAITDLMLAGGVTLPLAR